LSTQIVVLANTLIGSNYEPRASMKMPDLFMQNWHERSRKHGFCFSHFRHAPASW